MATRPLPATASPVDALRAGPAVLARVEELLREGQTAEAVRSGYIAAEADVIRAFGLQLPAQWTHRELFARFLRPDMGQVPRLLFRLHALYEPARYGVAAPSGFEALVPLLRSLYGEPPFQPASPLASSRPPKVPKPVPAPARWEPASRAASPSSRDEAGA